MAKSKLPENWKPAEVESQPKDLENIYEVNTLLAKIAYYNGLEKYDLLLSNLYKGFPNKTPKRGKLPKNWRSFLIN